MLLFCCLTSVISLAVPEILATTPNPGNFSAGGMPTYNYTNSTATPSTTPTPTTTTPEEPLCTSFMNKVPGSLMRGAERAIITCQCLSKSTRVQPCPDWKFMTGEEYVFVEEELFDSSSGEYCSVTYKFRVRTDIKVGRKPVELRCYLPDVDGPVESFYVFIDSPPPDPSPKTRLSVYMILAIVCFLVLTVSLFGFLFRWQIRTRRRAQRAAACRTPFVFTAPNRNGYFPPSVNDGFVHDNPPTYNEATLPQNAGQNPLFNNSCPVGGTTLQERIEKIEKTPSPVPNKQG